MNLFRGSYQQFVFVILLETFPFLISNQPIRGESQLKINGKLLIIQLLLWLMGELILNHLALDELADYTHFLRSQEEEKTCLIESYICLRKVPLVTI